MIEHYKRFNLTHLSSDTINKWIGDPCKAIMKFAGHGTDASVFWRGNAVEASVTNYFKLKQQHIELNKQFDRSKTIHASEQLALLVFEDRVDACKDQAILDTVPAERETLSAMLSNAPSLFISLEDEVYETAQVEVRHRFDEIAVPFIGYADIIFKDTVLEVKSSAYRKSKADPAHCRQVSFYAHCLDKEPLIGYITKRDTSVFAVPDAEQHLMHIEAA